MQNLLHTEVARPQSTDASRIAPLSQSRQTKMACAFLYRECVIRSVREPENEFSLRGTQVHEAACDYVNHLVSTSQKTDIAWYEQNILPRPYLPDALELLDGLKEKLAVAPETVLATELYLALDDDLEPIDYDELRAASKRAPGEAIEGTLDLVICPKANEADIHDYKTFWMICDADSFQSKLYPFLLFRHYPQLETVRFHLQFVRYSAERSVTFTRDDLPKLEKLVRGERARQIALHEAHEAAAIDTAQAMPGNHCAYCSLLRKCPLGDTNPMTQDPEEMARFGAWLTQASKQNTAALKALVNIQGPITITDGNGTKYEAGFHLQERSSYPLDDCLPVIMQHEPELAGKLTISGLSSPLKAKKRSKLAAELAGLKTTKAQTRFGIIGIDGDDEEEE